jgi:hypothetical protein
MRALRRSPGVDELSTSDLSFARDVLMDIASPTGSFVRESVNGVRDAILIGVAPATIVLLLYLRNVHHRDCGGHDSHHGRDVFLGLGVADRRST